MKKLITLIGLAVLFAGFTAQAQVPTYAAQTLWTTNGAGIPAATAVAGNVVMDTRKQASVAVQVTAQSDSNGAGVNFVFAPSLDGTTYGTTKAGSAFKTFSFTPAQTATTVITNWDTLGCGYWKLLYITNDTGAACTNISIKYGIKISAP